MSSDLDSSLLQALATRNGSDMSALIPQMLAAQLGEDSPAADLVSKYFALRQQAEERKSELPANEEESEMLEQCSAELEGARSRSARTAEALRELREKIESLYAELETLRQRNDSLAWAVGACCLCWGEDPQCLVCAGEGQPGFVEPDRELFIQVVVPAVRRFHGQRNADRTIRAGQQVLNH
jgi:hypothetical protein